MAYLFRHISIVDPESEHNGKTTDILLENGRITSLAKKQSLPKGCTEINAKGWQAFPGFCDLMVDFCDPGHEHREDIKTGTAAAAAGGFTAVCITANTSPIVQEKSNVEYLLSRANGSVVDVWPLGAVTEKMEGHNPTEMIDMYHAGAVAFSDAPHANRDSGSLLRALQYVQPLNSIVFSLPYDPSLSADGQVNEGEVSVKMGFKGIPDMAESLAVHRDIELARYAGAPIHLCGISTVESVRLVKQAKKEGLPVTATVFLHHLLLTEESAIGYDTNFKVFPPLRTEQDRKALIKAVLDGTIDTISTQHTPLDTEAKMLEFEYALPGIIGLETAYALLKTKLGKELPDEVLAKALSHNPRRIIRKNPAGITENSEGGITFVNPNEKWTWTEKSIRSKSRNSPFIGQSFTGKVMGVANKGKVVLF